MDGWMDGMTDKWKHGWMGKRMVGWIVDTSAGGWINGQTDEGAIWQPCSIERIQKEKSTT